MSHLDFYLMSLLSILHLTIFVAKLSFLFFQLSLCDLPECVDLVTLQLEVVPLLSLTVQLFSQSGDVLLQLYKEGVPNQLQVQY